MQIQKQVITCKYTHKKILQQKVHNKWLCLHYDNNKLDAQEVKEYELNPLYNTNPLTP